MVAQLASVPVASALLGVPVDLGDEAVDVDRQPALPGPAPARLARASAWPSTRSSWRTCSNVNERKNVPSVDGAIGRCPRTASVRPARSTSQSSIQLAPSSNAWTSQSTLRPGRSRPAPAKPDRPVDARLDPQPP